MKIKKEYHARKRKMEDSHVRAKKEKGGEGGRKWKHRIKQRNREGKRVRKKIREGRRKRHRI